MVSVLTWSFSPEGNFKTRQTFCKGTTHLEKVLEKAAYGGPVELLWMKAGQGENTRRLTSRGRSRCLFLQSRGLPRELHKQQQTLPQRAIVATEIHSAVVNYNSGLSASHLLQDLPGGATNAAFAAEKPSFHPGGLSKPETLGVLSPHRKSRGFFRCTH